MRQPKSVAACVSRPSCTRNSKGSKTIFSALCAKGKRSFEILVIFIVFREIRLMFQNLAFADYICQLKRTEFSNEQKYFELTKYEAFKENRTFKVTSSIQGNSNIQGKLAHSVRQGQRQNFESGIFYTAGQLEYSETQPFKINSNTHSR